MHIPLLFLIYHHVCNLDFQEVATYVTLNVYRTHLPQAYYMFTLLIGFVRISGSSSGLFGGAGAFAPFAPSWRC